MSTIHPKGTRLAKERGDADTGRHVSQTTLALRDHPTATQGRLIHVDVLPPRTPPVIKRIAEQWGDITKGRNPITVNHPGGVSKGSFSASVPPPSLMAKTNPTPFVFVAGLSANDKSYQSLANYLRNYYKSKLPPNTPILVTDHRQDIVKQVNAAFGTSTPFVLAGFSLGGAKSVAAAPQFGNRIKELVLLDPVDPARAGKPNPVGFNIPANVTKAVAYTRNDNNRWPFSTTIAKGGSTIRYNGNANADVSHSQAIFNTDSLKLILSALSL